MPLPSRTRTIPVAATLVAALLAVLATLDIDRKVDSFRPLGVELEPRGAGWLVQEVTTPETGLETGDLILFVEGREPTSRRDLADRLEAREQTELEILRQGEPRQVLYERPPLEIDVSYLILAAAGIAYLAIGLFVVVRRPKPPAGLFFSWCAASAAVYLLTFVPSAEPSVWARTSFLVEELARLLLPPLTLHLFLRFPAPTLRSSRLRRVVPFLYLPAVALATLQIDLIFFGGGTFFDGFDAATLGLLDRLELLLLGLYTLAALALLVRGLRRDRGWETRRQLQGIALGLAVGYLPFVLLYAGPFALGWSRPDWLTVLAVIPLILVPLAFAWAILRYQLWNLDLVVRRTVSYTITLLLGVLTFSVVHLLIDRGLAGGAPMVRNLLTFAAGLFIAGVLVPAERRLRRRVERWQYRETYESRRSLRDLGKALLEERDLSRLVRRLRSAILDALGTDPLELYLVRDGELARAGGASSHPRRLPLGLLDEESWDRDLIPLGGPSLPGTDREPVQELRSAGFRYVLPMALHDDPVGLLLIGHRGDGYPINAEELDLLRDVLDRTVLAIENARLVGALQKQIDEKERLRRQSEQILASSPVGIAVLDGEDRVILANRAFAELTGSDPEAVSGISLEKLLPVRPIPGPDEGTVEAAFCEPDGTERHLQLSTADFSGAGSGLKVLVAHDVTDKVTMEHALQEKERLAALGMLAAGLAHEVNTPITGISSYAQLLLEDTPEEDPRHALLEKMERQTFRASRIVNNLLEFARNRDHEARPLDLRRIVDEALETVTDRFDQAPIRVEWEPPAEPQTVLAGDGDLHQVLVNLIANGCDAMTPEGGTLRLGMESDDGNIRTRVEDDGVGIPPEQLDRIFEPFFSTKVGMGGTGLGLAISHQIVRRLGGTLKVESSPGEGTRFVLELPRHDRDSANRT